MKWTMILGLMLAFLAFGGSVQAQKVKVKGDAALVDGAKVCGFEDDASTRGSFYINDLEGNQLLFYKWVYVQDMNLNYYEVYKPEDLNTILYEEQATTGFKKSVVQRLMAAKALSNEGINEENLAQHGAKLGKEFSRKREEAVRN